MSGKLSAQLNENQQKAIDHIHGPLLIVAGAGTGKTFTLVEKIKYLIKNNLAKPEEILCLTFTEKSAFEMEERVDKAMPYGYFQMWISTFHSFADDILRKEISHIGLNPDYTLMTQAEAIVFLRKRLFLFNLHYFRPLGNPHKFIDSLLHHFSRLRDEDISPEQYIAWANEQLTRDDVSQEEKDKNIELAHAYETYQKIKIEEGFADFGDLIYYLLDVFRKRPNILNQYRKQFKYFLVDEFQDTNIAQYQLIKLLCPGDSNPNLTVVGDDSQAIYKFRGASISNILTFMKDYPTAEQVTLNDNYRSNQSVLDYSHTLIQHNNPDTLESQLGISKQLKSHKPNDKNAVTFFLTERVDHEADIIVKEIIKLQKKYKYELRDFAILVRANNHADPFLHALARNGIPYQFLGPGMLFKQPEVKDLIAYLKILANLEDSISFYRILTMQLFNLDTQDINLLLTFAKKISLPLYQATEIYLSFHNDEWYRSEHFIYKEHLPLLKEESRMRLIEIVTMIKKHLDLIQTDTAGQILYDFFDQSGYLPYFTSVTTEKEEKRIKNITKFFDRLKNFENEHEDASVFAVVDYIEMSMEMGESPVAGDTDIALANAINILTIHSSKGLEFPVVFLPNLIRGRFPTYERKETIPVPAELIKEILPQGDYHVQEERRLFYVGLTRAQDKVYLTASQFYGDGKRARKISPFVIETLGEEAVNNIQLLKKEEEDQLSIFEFKKVAEVVTKEQLQIHNFSYSQLETFNTCPLQYKYQYVLRIPTSQNSSASFGDTIHKTLQRFYQEYIQDNSITLDRMFSIYESMWIPLGYSSQDHQKKMKQEGRAMLQRFFEHYHNEYLQINDLERLFKVKINDDVFLTGKIDRVDNQGDDIEIIDYKTGRKPDDKEIKKSLQLSIYALAANSNNLYDKPFEKINLTFYYLQTMEKVTMKRTQEELEAVKETIQDTANKIRMNEFPAKVGIQCDYCPFKMICEAW